MIFFYFFDVDVKLMFYFDVLFRLASPCMVHNPRQIVTSYRFNPGFIISSHLSSKYLSLTSDHFCHMSRHFRLTRFK